MIGDVRWSSRRKNNNIILEGGYFESSSSLSLSLSRRIWWTRRGIFVTVVLEREYDCSSDRISNIRVQISIDIQSDRVLTYTKRWTSMPAGVSSYWFTHWLGERGKNDVYAPGLLSNGTEEEEDEEEKKRKRKDEERTMTTRQRSSSFFFSSASFSFIQRKLPTDEMIICITVVLSIRKETKGKREREKK